MNQYREGRGTCGETSPDVLRVEATIPVTTLIKEEKGMGDLRVVHVKVKGEQEMVNGVIDTGAQMPVRESCGSPVVKVSDHGRNVTSSSAVPLKTRRVGQQCTLNLSRAEMFSRWCGVPTQVSSTSLDHVSKLRGPSPKALV
ncbi:uncharacterized protein TNCV_2642241 [Trichonephila clavipes]|nr:uncharacterized protein TNCV_2642241 [Trichonephila clavipes]